MGGGGGSYSKTSRKAAPKSAPKVSKGPKKPTHSQLVAKWQEQGGKFVEEKKEWTKADIDRARRAKEAAEEAAAAAAAAGSAPPPPEEEEQSGPAGPTVAELARARMAELAIQMQTLSTEAAPTVDAETYAAATVDELRSLAECRRSQLEELEMVEAMFPEEFLLSSNPVDVEALRAAVEALDETDVEALLGIAAHRPLEFMLQMTVSDQRAAAVNEAEKEGEEQEVKELVASVLLRVRFPALYPTPEHPPLLHVEDVMITEAIAELGKGKVLSTLALLDEGAMMEAMLEQAREVLPNPCVYEMVNWMSENAFKFVRHTWT